MDELEERFQEEVEELVENWKEKLQEDQDYVASIFEEEDND